jgi:hypothetical protein
MELRGKSENITQEFEMHLTAGNAPENPPYNPDLPPPTFFSIYLGLQNCIILVYADVEHYYNSMNNPITWRTSVLYGQFNQAQNTNTCTD